MEPLSIAIGFGLITALTKLVEKGVVDPALQKGTEPFRDWLTHGYDEARDGEKLKRALTAAAQAAQSYVPTNPDAQHRWNFALTKALPEGRDLAARTAAAALEMVNDDLARVPPDLLKDLNIENAGRAFAHYLRALRAELAKLGGYYGIGIELADRAYQQQRLDGLYELVASAVGKDEVGKTFVWAKLLPSDTRALEKPYLEKTVHECRRLSLEGRAKEEAVAGRKTEPIHLEQVYVALNTMHSREIFLTDEELKEHNKRFPTGVITEDDSNNRKTKQIRLSAVRAVMQERHLVLLGDPGSGKSTLARHLCLCLAGARLGDTGLAQEIKADDLEGWELPAYLPVLVRLRDFAADRECLPEDTRERGEAKHLLKFIRQNLQAEGWPELADHVQKLLEAGEALLVLDGLDEVTHPNRAAYPNNMPKADDDRRTQVAQAVQDLARVRCARARLLVTCRVKQYSGPFNWRLPFPDFTLADFSDKQSARFVHSWFTALNKPEKGQTLLDALARRAELGALRPKPILLTQMAIVHGDDKLPDSRVKLYEKCVQLLLWDWEYLRAVQTGRAGKTGDEMVAELAVDKLKRDELEEALFEAVFHEHASGQPELREDVIREKLSKRLLGHNLAKALALSKAQQFVDEWLNGRNGLFLPARGNTFEMPHRSFQEYLAGWWLAKKGLPKADGETEDWDDCGPRLAIENPALWREPFRFAVALDAARTKAILNALENLWPEESQPNPEQAETLLLAGQTIVDVGPAQFREPAPARQQKIFRRVQRALVHLMRDTEPTDDYPSDPPRFSSIELLKPASRLAAGELLNEFGWTPSDLYQFVKIDSPPSAVNRPPSFLIAKYPVTNAQYARFVTDDDYAKPEIWHALKAYDHQQKTEVPMGEKAWEWFTKNDKEKRRPLYWDDKRLGQHRRLAPVVGVTWYEAAAYCEWLTRHWHELAEAKNLAALIPNPQSPTFRLPLEDEWVLAAGGEGPRIKIKDGDEEQEISVRYPWQISDAAKQPSQEEILARANVYEAQLGTTSPVAMYPAGASQPHGLMDMVGNVWEWQANFSDEEHRFLRFRGGAWRYDRGLARVAEWLGNQPDFAWSLSGFRVVGVSPVSR